MRSNKVFLTFSVCLAMMTFLIAGCPSEEDTSKCPEGACVPNGSCVVVDNNAQCACDAGYVQGDMGLICELDTGDKKLGEECVDSAVCETGWCLKYTGEDTGYCSKRDCQGNDACTNYSGDGAEMCCVDVGGEYFICMKIVPGYPCGTQDGMCGSSCAGTMDSACDPTQACLAAGAEDPNAVCAHECTTNDDCSDCADPETPGLEFTCQPISGGVTYCLGDGDDDCASSLDCEGDDVCIPWPTADDMGLEGMCGKLGDLPTGTECDEDDDPNELPASERCADFYCMNNHCSEVCVLETDCPFDMVCHSVLFGGMGPDGNGTADIGMCLWISPGTPECSGDADCPAGTICDYYLPPGGTTQKVCSDWRCDPAEATCGDVGDQCGGNLAPCANGLCLVFTGEDLGTCSSLCDTDADCPDSGDPNTGYVCSGLQVSDDQVTGACIIAEFGSSEFGDPCIFGAVNADSDDCAQGLACLGYSDAGVCSVDADCEDLGVENNPDCAGGQCGVSFCASRCEADNTCDQVAYPDSAPAMVGGTCYCMPAVFGTSEFGDPCIFGAVNADSDNCASGLSCLGYTDAGACATDADCLDLGEESNPDCAGGQCGVSFCAAPCDNGSCDAYPDSAPADVGGTCYCMPVTVGTSDVGDPCIFGSVNADSDHCMSGMSCLGNDSGDACSVDLDCGDADDVTNPDCVDSVCGFSFCAPPCDAGSCDAYPGTEATQVSGTCYCTPAVVVPTGPQAVGEPCIFGSTNADTDHCLVDLACLGIPASVDTQACSVDADCTDSNAAHNPDCVDVSGVFYCGVSFCSAQCAGDGTCDAGFLPIDVSGTCYCEPE